MKFIHLMILSMAIAALLRSATPTLVDLRTQTKSVDFTFANSTRPVKTGTLLPATCTTGDLYFKTDAPAGANLYACIALNTWATQGGIGVLGGDVTGQSISATVNRIQGRSVATTAPVTGQALVWNGTTTRWEPQTISGGNPTMSGDVTGPASATTVTQIQGRPIAASAPSSGQALIWNSTTTRWEPQALPSWSGPLSGDVTGQPSATTVTQIQGHAVSPALPQAGQTLVWNATSNSWEPQLLAAGGGTTSGAGVASQLGDFAMSKASSTLLNIGANCSASSPCNVRFGSIVYSFSSGASITLSSGTGDAYVYIASTGALTVGHNLSLICSAGCVAQAGITGFPSDSIPLFSWHATNGAWDSSVDERAFLSSKNVLPGTGMTASDTSGHTVLSADPAVIGLRTAVPVSSTSACTAGAWAVDSTYYYICVAPNSWRRMTLSTW